MRNQIRAEVQAIDPLDEIEREHVRAVLAWIDSGVELCRLEKPATPPMHLVSYFALVDTDKILLVDHRNARLWLPSGGHVEPSEHPRATVSRELREELGIELEQEIGPPLMITCSATVGLTAGHTDVSLWYVVNADHRRDLKFDTSEFSAVQWFSFVDAPLTRSDPHLGRFLKKLALCAERPRC